MVHCQINSVNNFDYSFARLRLETETNKRSCFLIVCEVLESMKVNLESTLLQIRTK
jgi:hypothetical protein